MVPYDADQVSLPRLGGKPVPLETVLDGAAAELVRNFEQRILRPEETEQTARCYTDVVLRRSRARYLGFLKQLADRNLLVLTRLKKGGDTPFFVSKKAGKQRLVLDCHASNELFFAAPYTEIASAESFASIEVEKHDLLYIAAADVEACFYQVAIPPAFSRYFCLKCVSTDEARLTGLDRCDGGPF